MSEKYFRFIFLVSFLVISFIAREYHKIYDFYDKKTHIYFLDVGQGDASLIKLPNRKLILIDGGPTRIIIYRLSDVLPFWVKKIDNIIITHSHADHLTGVVYVIEKYEVGEVLYYNLDDSISSVEDKLRELLLTRDITIINPYGYVFGYNEMNIRLKNYPPKVPVNEKNENLESVLTLFTFNNFDILFTGDAEMIVQKNVINSIDRDIEVIKIPHQGSSDSYYPPLLKKLKPELGVVMVGKDNIHGHPHKKVTDGYEKLKIRVLRTDKTGTIHLRTDGITWEVLQ